MYDTANSFLSIPYLSFHITAFPITYLHYYLLIVSLVCFALAIVLALIKYLIIASQIKEPHTLFAITIPHDAKQSPFSTEQLFATIHMIEKSVSLTDIFLKRKQRISLEIVATHETGIRFLIYAKSFHVEIMKKNILSYMPYAKIEEADEYLPASFHEYQKLSRQLFEMKLTNQFAYPLQQQTILKEHDPIAYLTGHMTNLQPGEVVALHIVLSPLVQSIHKQEFSKIGHIRWLLRNGYDITPALKKSVFKAEYILFSILLLPILYYIYISILTPVQREMILIGVCVLIGGIWYFWNPTKIKKERVLSQEQTTLHKEIGDKISDNLFETSIRVYIQANTGNMSTRIQGLLAAIISSTRTTYQSLTVKRKLVLFHNISLFHKYTYLLAKNRLLSEKNNPVLSISEVTSLYHFPYTPTTKTQDIPKIMSPELPAPLLLKNSTYLDVVFGKNRYGEHETDIGLTDDDRSRHVFIEGQTGSGKSTIMFHMAKDDIQKGLGVCVVDPHGDLVEDLLHTVPYDRINDVVYINPFDIAYPIHINLLEIPSGLTEDEQALERELVAESIISIFRRVFSDDEKTNAHRIERILRNTIYTAFYSKNPTIFTVNKLLTNEAFRNSIIASIDNEHLLDFWREEFGKAGDYQLFKIIDGVTSKVERFLFSEIAKRILEKPNSTINFNDLLDQGKIIFCNLSEGKIGEDNARLLGTTILTEIHLAINRRAQMDKALRKPFYLFVDEFQNFANSSFTKMLSGARKYGLRITIAEQSTTQQPDERTTNRILANVGTVICFRTASPIDEALLLPQFAPLIEKGALLNLPRYRFYMKLAALDPQEAFSGQTLPITIQKDLTKVAAMIDASRNNYAHKYENPKKVNTHKQKVKKQEEKKDIENSLV